MSRIGLLSRAAFICNCCLLLVFGMRYLPPLKYGPVVSTVIIAGLVLSFIINGVVNILYAWLLLRKQPLRLYVPVWLAAINFLFLILQVYMIL